MGDQTIDPTGNGSEENPPTDHAVHHPKLDHKFLLATLIA